MKKKIITAKDIAKACGISQATVSYIINNKEGKKISEATREKVLQTIKDLHYIPNNCARAMRTNKAMSIGVVSGRDLIHVGFNRVLRGIKRYGDTKGYSVTLLNSEDSEESKVYDYISDFRANKIDGILFVFYEISDVLLNLLEEEHIPYLMINENGVWHQEIQEEEPFRDVLTECVTFCKKNSFKNIGFVRKEGCNKTYKYQLFEEQLRKGIEEEACDIVISPTQRLALMTQSAILKNAFQIPQKTKHICLGEGYVFKSMYPTVTAFDIPLEEMGAHAAEVIITQLNGGKVETQSFEYKMMYGMSTEV